MDDSNAGEVEREAAFGAHRGMSLGERIRAEDSYGVLLILILVTLITSALAGRSAAGRAVAVILQGGVLMFALWTSRAGRYLVKIAIVVVPLIVAVTAVLTGNESDAARGAVAAANAALALGAIIAIVRRVGRHPRVDAATILGAVSTYLLIGMFFSAVFATIGAFGTSSFFVTAIDARGIDYPLLQLRDDDDRGIWGPDGGGRSRPHARRDRGAHRAAVSRHRGGAGHR